MRLKTGLTLAASVAITLTLPPAACGADADGDALALQTPTEMTGDTFSGAKFFLETGFGRGQRRYLDGHDQLRRVSADFVYSTRLDAQWRFVLSDRVDAIDPHRGASTINSLRELYAGWQDGGATWVVDIGRINLRQGPALGFNPTDFFRDGSVRVSTTVNPLLVREYRMGSVMARVQRLWSDGSFSIATSPKLANGPTDRGFGVDFGSTNNRDRALLSLSTQWSSNASSQLHVYKERDGSTQVGASGSGLLGGATVAYFETTWGRELALLDRTLGARSKKSAGRVASGVTFTTESKLSITGEVEYNGVALSQSQWNAVAASQPARLIAYSAEAERRQDIGARRAVLVYAKQADVIRNLDATALVRLNTQDHSSLTWLELRYRLEGFDVAAQWLRYRGAPLTEFGLSPYKTSIQLLVSAYF